MSRRFITLASSTALMLVMALGSAGPAQAASLTAKEKAERARVVKYWTPQRMANAIPRDFVKKDGRFVPAGKGGTRGKPPKDPGDGSDSGGTGTSVVTGASWTTKDKGLYATGKVFFTLGTTNYVCSGSVVADGRNGHSTVLTAGHCAYDETNDRWAANFMFVPAYDETPVKCSSDCHVASALVVHEGYASAGGFNRQAIQHDWAFAVFPDGGPAGALDGGGRFEISFVGPNSGDTRQSFGYPAAGKYYGSDLVYCLGPVSPDSSYGTWGLACDMTGGSSGGPWVRDFGGADEALNSVNSYKYNGGPVKDFMFGPDFNDKTKKTFAVALGATDQNLEAFGSAN
jgi:V8-like Glu-specific endopeptidase